MEGGGCNIHVYKMPNSQQIDSRIKTRVKGVEFFGEGNFVKFFYIHLTEMVREMKFNEKKPQVLLWLEGQTPSPLVHLS